jgi:hypothetical protein
MLHISLHILIPALVSWLFFRTRWKMVWLIMMLTMLVDLDHLLANPIYDPNRCSIGFHPFHSYLAITAYLVMSAISKTRVIAYGLLIHMALDGLYCIRLAL